ncbi:MAG: 3,4-dihydroxy-2-butanone-4-phosphate synthase [Lawsonella clevelandensis]
MLDTSPPQNESEIIAFESIETAIEEFRQGRPVVVVDDDNRENEGDLIFPAAAATPELLAFMIRYTSGYICVGMDASICDRLALPIMWEKSEDRRLTAYTVSVDAAEGTTTGISAHDRALTIKNSVIPRLLRATSIDLAMFCRFAP